MQRQAVVKTSNKYNLFYANKFHVSVANNGNSAQDVQRPQEGQRPETAIPIDLAAVGRQKVSSNNFFRQHGSRTLLKKPATNNNNDLEVPYADELREYKKLKQISWKTDWDALHWWRDHQLQYPNLSVMARQYLGVPATSASVERLFSVVGLNFVDHQKKISREFRSNSICKIKHIEYIFYHITSNNTN